jgi:DNA-binding transcriptional ArsR family regulator
MAPKRDSEIDATFLGALAHPVRIRIMQEAHEEVSPKRIADVLGDVSVQLVSYHFRILRDAGLLTLERTEPRRGAIEHFYRASPEAAKQLKSIGAALSSFGESLGSAPRKRAPRKKS